MPLDRGGSAMGGEIADWRLLAPRGVPVSRTATNVRTIDTRSRMKITLA